MRPSSTLPSRHPRALASWSQGSVWPVFGTHSAGCRTVVFLLLVSAPLVGGTGLCPLVGRAMSRGVSRGGCGLRESIGSLSADGWGCIPTQFVVWPEVSQHWSLQVVGWGQVLLPKCQLLGELIQMNAPQYVRHWCLHPQSGPQPSPASPGDPPRQTGRSGPGSCEITAFALGPGARGSLCAPLRVESLFPPILWSSCNQAPLVFKVKRSGGSSSWCPTLGLGV